MKYVIIAILIYLVYLFARRFLRNYLFAHQRMQNRNKSRDDQQNTPGKKNYDVNMIQDAEFREIKKDE